MVGFGGEASRKRGRNEDPIQNPSKKATISSSRADQDRAQIELKVNDLIAAIETLHASDQAPPEAWESLKEKVVEVKTLINKIQTPGDRSQACKVVDCKIGPVVSKVLEEAEASCQNSSEAHRNWEHVGKELRLARDLDNFIGDVLDTNLHQSVDRRVRACLEQVVSETRKLLDDPSSRELGFERLHSLQSSDPSHPRLVRELVDAHLRSGNTVLGRALAELSVISEDLTFPQADRSVAHETFQRLAMQAENHNESVKTETHSSLQFAIEKSWDRHVILALIQQGASLSESPAGGDSPFKMLFDRYPHDEAMQLIADGLGIPLPENRDSDLMWALRNEQVDLACAMMNRDLTLFGNFRREGRSAEPFLTAAIDLSNGDIIKVFIDNFLAIPEFGDFAGILLVKDSFPLIDDLLGNEDADSKRLEVAQYLLETALQVKKDGIRWGEELLVGSLSKGIDKVARRLISMGVSKERTLKIAFKLGNKPVLCKLLQYDAKVDQSLVREAMDSWEDEIVIAMIANCPNVNEKGDSRETLLQLAIEDEQSEVALALINAGADVTAEYSKAATNSGVATCLDLAVAGDLGAVVAAAVDKIESIDSSSRVRETMFRKATRWFKQEAALALIEKEKRFDSIEEEGAAMLERLISSDFKVEELALALIRKGVPVEEKTSSTGESALVSAVTHTRNEVVAAIIDRGGDVNQRLVSRPAVSVLELALGEDNSEASLALIEAGANISDRASSGSTFLEFALDMDLTEVALALIGKGLLPDSPELLKKVIDEDRSDIMSALLDQGIDVDSKIDGDQTLLQTAIGQDKRAVALLLIERGANVNVENKDGERLIDPMLKSGGNRNILLALLSKNAKISEELKSSDSGILHRLIAKKESALVVALIKAGLSLEGRDSEDRSLLDHAIAMKQTEVCLALIERGACLEDNEGWEVIGLPAMEALFRGLDEVVMALSDKESLKAAGVGEEKLECFASSKLIDEAIAYNKPDVALAMIKGGMYLEGVDEEGNTLLQNAIGKGHAEVCLALLDKGVPVKGVEVIIEASRAGMGDVVRALATKIFPEDGSVKVEDFEELNSSQHIYDAIRQDSPDVALALVQIGVRLDYEDDWDERTLLQYAIDKEYAEVCLALIERGVSLNEERLILDAARGRLDGVVVKLLEKGISVGALEWEGEGQDCFLNAIQTGQEELALKLIEEGVPLAFDFKTDEGDTLFDVAVRAGLSRVAQKISEATGVSAPMNVDDQIEAEPRDFDAASLKVLVNYLNTKGVLSMRPLRLEGFTVFPFKVERLNANGEKKKITEIHIQKEEEASDCGKLILQMDLDGMVDRVYLDGEEMPSIDLFREGSSEGEQVSRLLNVFMTRLALKVPSSGRRLDVHQQALSRVPEAVLPHVRTGQTYTFLSDTMNPQPGVDAGGPKRKFFNELSKGFFSGRPERVTQMNSGMIQLRAGDNKGAERLEEVGEKLFYRAYSDSQLSLGRVLDDQFFNLVSLFFSGDEPSSEQVMMALQDFLGDGINASLLQAYRMDPPQLSEDAREKIQFMGYDEEEIPSSNPEELKKFIVDLIFGDDNGHAQMVVRAARHVAKGFLKGVEAEEHPFRERSILLRTTPAKLSEKIQGKALDRQDIISRIRCRSPNPVVRQKTEWLKKYILESDDREVLAFIEAVTGSSAITGETDFKIQDAGRDKDGRKINNCQAETCFNTLCVPGHHTDVGTDVVEGKTYTNEEKFINNLRLLYSERGFDMA